MRVRATYQPVGHQRLVNSHFTAAAAYWADVYGRHDDVDAAIFQERLRRVLELVDGLALPMRATVLEVGCGAGYGTIALANRGFVVKAIDAVQSMVDATRARAAGADLQLAVDADLGDVHALPARDESFDLVLALGVLDWFPSMERPIQEMARVLKSGGSAIVTMDNRWGLRQFVEPYTNPILRPAKEALKRLLPLPDRNSGRALTYVASPREVDATLRRAGLDKLAGLTLGFGPFRVFNRTLLPNVAGVKVHRALQRLSERGFPVLPHCGGQYVVLATKRGKTSA